MGASGRRDVKRHDGRVIAAGEELAWELGSFCLRRPICLRIDPTVHASNQNSASLSRVPGLWSSSPRGQAVTTARRLVFPAGERA